MLATASAGIIQVLPSSKLQLDLPSSFPDMSRVRSHKGNIPSLPQTKQCSMCPAKFTRTTHLNRHIRSHTNERQHQCDICHSQFTRSDLLTRHKRTCGDNSNVYRSRRKSCQACAESKIRCDLEFPCSKCVSRGKECIFVNDPEASKAKRLAAAERARRNKAGESSKPAAPAKERSTSVTSIPQQSQEIQLSPNSALFPSGSRRGSFDTPVFSFSSSTSSSSAPSPGSEEFDPIINSFGPPHLMPTLTADDPATLAAHLKALLPHRPLSSDLFKPLSFEDQYASLLPAQSQHFQPTLADFHSEQFAWLDSPGELDGSGTLFPHDYQLGSHAYGVLAHDHFAGVDFTAPPSTASSSVPDLIPSAQPSLDGSQPSPLVADRAQTGCSTDYGEPPAAELQHYLYLFFSAFSTQVPLIHVPTWQMEGKPMVLIRAMQACGALFVRTPVAQKFIIDTLGCTRDILMLEFAKTPTDSPEYLALVIAVVLLQTIGLFHQSPEIRSSSNVYHGMLVMMIRRTGLIGRIANWSAPDIVHGGNRDSAWHEWCTYETAKRALIFAYLHDCFHSILFAIAPSFRSCEFDIGLPCDDSLWQASSSTEWLSAIQAGSNTATAAAQPSACGTSMQTALAYLNHDSSLSSSLPVPPPLNPFGHFVLILTVLRDLYECRTSGSSVSPSIAASSSGETESALRNWLHAWLTHEPASLSSPSLPSTRAEPPFSSNPMPFFWLAQVSLLEVREGQSLLAFKASGGIADGRFTHVSRWMASIRSLVSKGKLDPEVIWEQLMGIRSRGVESESDYHENEGLLGFFANR